MFGLLRSNNQRMLKLSELSVRELGNEGPTACPVVVVITRGGKNNHVGKLQYASFMRNKNPFVCPVFFLSVYLFARQVPIRSPSVEKLIKSSFQHGREIFPNSDCSFPSFRRRKDWYDLPLLCDDDNATRPISYSTQRRAIDAAIKDADVRTTQSTHINRKTGARLAEEGGAANADIARAGGWAMGVMENVYLTNIPRPALRALAGFNPQGGTFYLPRAVDVPDNLQRRVFPEVEKWCVRSLTLP